MRLSRSFIEDLLLIGRAGPRFIDDSAVQIDVWAAYGEDPKRIVDLLLTPLNHLPAARLAQRLYALIHGEEAEWVYLGAPTRIVPLEGFVAIRASGDVFLRVLLPLAGLDAHAAFVQLQGLVTSQLAEPSEEPPPLQVVLDFVVRHRASLAPDLRLVLLHTLLGLPDLREVGTQGAATVADLRLLLAPIAAIPFERGPAVRCDDRLVWQIARNREVEPMGRSVETVKADAARRLFQASARDLVWAVIDSGIDGSHPAFRDHEAGGFATRIVKAFDFSHLREIAAYDALLDPHVEEALKARILAAGVAEADVDPWLERLREDARNGRPFDWAILGEILETPSDRLEPVGGKPVGHGTHVAGVLAGDWRENDRPVYEGVCPDLRLYDLRVLGDSAADTEFAVIAALEFVRWLNARNRYLTIHGVNLSLGLAHDVRNFACGQTPVCRACDATVRAGVVVVAAAGNWGYQDFTTQAGSYRGYATVSIADPGNTESVITVGATHRDRPHEYGVSFFSSRGPTGDGRSKPDLVAPGEKIDGPLPGLGLGKLDGTSMAAPHVSGVAALLMARHAELVGRPMDVKRILVDTATDLGRERHFQGAGLVDALRALQSR